MRTPGVFATVWVLLLAVRAAGAEERVLLRTDVEPVVRAGRTFVSVRAVAEAFDAQVQWLPSSREVVVSRDGRRVRLRVGATTARVDGRAAALAAAPFIEQGRVLVPLRFVGERLGFPVRHEQATQSVLLAPAEAGGATRVLPLPSLRAGIHVLEPPPGAVVRSPLRVHGQANVFEGTVVIEVVSEAGRVLGAATATGAMGSFHPFTAEVVFTLPPGVTRGRVLLYSPGARAEGERLQEVSVPVRFGDGG